MLNPYKNWAAAWEQQAGACGTCPTRRWTGRPVICRRQERQARQAPIPAAGSVAVPGITFSQYKE